MGMYDAYDEEQKRREKQHRKWNWSWGSGYKAEHNALYDAYEAERQRAEEAEAEVQEHRRHVATLMSREDAAHKTNAELRNNLRLANSSLHNLNIANSESHTFKAHLEKIISQLSQERDRLQGRIRELEARAEVPPGVPSVETLYELYKGTCNTASCTKDWPHGMRKVGIAAVRDAVLAALPVLTREEVEKQHHHYRGFSLSDVAPDTFTGWLASRLPARLEPVPVTEEEIAQVIRDEADNNSGTGWGGSAAAVMSLLREKQLVQEPEPIATPETLEQLAEIGWNVDREEFNRLYGSENYRAVNWQAAGDIDKKAFVSCVAAILRAARPEIRIDPQPLLDTINSKMSWTAKYDFLASRIRYRVDLPPTECPTCKAVRAALDEKGGE